MSWGFGAAGVAGKILEFHKELVATTVRFEELRRQTQESLADFSTALSTTCFLQASRRWAHSLGRQESVPVARQDVIHDFLKLPTQMSGCATR